MFEWLRRRREVRGARMRRSRQLRVASWHVGLTQENSRLRSSWARERQLYDDHRSYSAVIGTINEQLIEAGNELEEFRHLGWVRRRLLATSVYEQVLAYLQAASEDLLLIEDEGAVLAKVPAIRAAIKHYIRVDDPRFDSYMKFIDSLVSSESRTDNRALTAENQPEGPASRGEGTHA